MATLEVDEKLDTLDDNAFHERIGEILTRELSLRGYLRFIRLYGPHTGNYTEDRHKWLDGVTVEELLADTKTQEPAH